LILVLLLLIVFQYPLDPRYGSLFREIVMIFIDIETSPTKDVNLIKKLTSEIQPPSNYKKQESIDKWWATNGAEKEQEVIQKTALDGLYGMIRCIGYAIEDDEPVILAGDEYTILSDFFTMLETEEKEMRYTPDICGHNVIDFDLKFINHRSIVNGIKPPFFFNSYLRKSDFVYDTMRMWAGWRDTVSLENLAQGLLGRGKSGDGKNVFKMDDEQVAQYCKDDVALTRDVFWKLTFTE